MEVESDSPEALSPGVTVRPAAFDDGDRMLLVFAEGDAFHRAALPSMFREAAEPFPSRERIGELIDNSDSLLLVATHGDHLAGFLEAHLTAAPELPIFVPRRFVFINSMAVLSGWRRRGVGRKLLAAVEQWAQEKGATGIELTVFEFNSGARALYEQVGYTTTQRRMTKGVHPMDVTQDGDA